MENSMQLQQTVLHDIIQLLDDTDAMKQILEFVHKLKAEKGIKAESMSLQEKEKILTDIKEGLAEVKNARKNGVKLQTVEDFINELHH